MRFVVGLPVCQPLTHRCLPPPPHSGQLSPESLNLALNRTQVAAAQLNKWFHGRVELFAKYQ